MIALTQLLIKFVLINPFSHQTSLNNYDFYLLVISTIMIAAAGNIINDYFDVKVDRINNRKIIIDKSIKKRVAILLHISFSFIGIAIGFYLAWKVALLTLGFINLFCVISLWYYSTDLKRKPLIGNILVAILSSLVLLVVPLYDLIPDPGVNFIAIFNKIIYYSFYAFFFSLIREIVKDMEDYEGDNKTGMKTFAISVGLKKSKSFLKALTILILCSFIYILSFTFKSDLYSFLYLLLLLTIPLTLFLILLFKSNSKKDFYLLSQILKLIMVAGILSLFII
jgi:4-hydroxybenzoate polyprenyltransferase